MFRRKLIRKKGWDYAGDGIYFITMVVHDRKHAFGKIENQKMQLSTLGKVASHNWSLIPEFAPFVKLDEFIVMPDHMHGLLHFENTYFINSQIHERQSKKPHFGSQSQNLASVLRGFKSSVTMYAKIHNINFRWQPNYFERIIKDNEQLNNVRAYIRNNPIKWSQKHNTPKTAAP